MPNVFHLPGPPWFSLQTTFKQCTINDIETKAETFRYRSLLLEQNQNVLIWSAYYWNKIGTFQSVPKLFKIKMERLGDFLKFKSKPEQNLVNLLSDRNISIHLGFRANKLLQTISKFFYQFGTFFFAPSCSGIKTERFYF
jgi:hypothetical protein